MNLTVSVNPTAAIRALDGHLKQIPFTVSKALNAVAKDGVDAGTASMPTKFDRPNPFTKKALTFTPATKANQTATVLAKDAQAKYLAIQETGGERRPERGRVLSVPVTQRLNQFGNIPRGAIKREISRPDTFMANGRGETEGLAPGVYRRVGGKGNKRGAAPRLLVAFVRRASYKPRFGLHDTVRDAVGSKFQARLAEAVQLALSTAK